MVKLLLVSGGDYSAIYFEQDNPNLSDVYKQAISSPKNTFIYPHDEEFICISAFVFDDVVINNEFMSFIKKSISDHDSLKSSNIYIVE